jgi:hypothetical protein
MSKIGKLASMLLLFGFSLWGCGGGGGDGVFIPVPSQVRATGVFVDGPVQGLTYATSPGGIKGVTGAGGTYDYLPGDTVRFTIGDLVIGTATAKGVVTPRDLAKYAQPNLSDAALDNVAVRIVQVLMTLNSSIDPVQGMVINPSLLTSALGTHFQQIDILNPASDLSALVAELTAKPLVDATTAGLHLKETMATIAISAQSGEYIALDAAGNTALYIVAYNNGMVTGSGCNLLNYNQVYLLKGNFIKPTSSDLVLTVSEPSSGAVLASITGICDGLGKITVKATAASSSSTSNLTLHRLLRSRAPYFGIYRGQYLDSAKNSAGTVCFGTDETGVLFGWALPKNGDPTVDTFRVTGSIDSKGVIAMTGSKSGAQLTFAGTFTTSGNRHFFGNWTDSGTASGTFIVDDINEPIYTVINPASP